MRMILFCIAYIISIHILSPTESYFASSDEMNIIIYPTMNEALHVATFRLIVVDFRKMVAGSISSFFVHVRCEDEEDVNLIEWDEDFKWVQKGLIPNSGPPTIMALRLMQNGSAPILRITGEKPVVLICDVVAFDIHDNALTRGSTRFSIRNRWTSSRHYADLDGRMEDICDTFESGSTSAAFDDSFVSPHPIWSEYHVDQRGITYQSESWEVAQEDTRNWISYAAMAAGRYVFESHSGNANLCDDQILENDFDFPVFVMNLQHRTDKRMHMKKLLCELGFSNVAFPTTTHADDLDISSLILSEAVSAQAITGIIGPHGVAALRPYVANTIDRVRTLERAAADGHPLFGVFEDDLVAGACPSETNRRIAAALRELPPDADVLYLEACYEQCGALRCSAQRPSLARVSEPHCAAGMIFTARGARRVAALCTPITAGFDDMMPELVALRKINAYLAMPGVLYQDCFWGSDANRTFNANLQVRTHRYPALRVATRALATAEPNLVGGRWTGGAESTPS
jgi:hypothetical protein